MIHQNILNGAHHPGEVTIVKSRFEWRRMTVETDETLVEKGSCFLQ